MVFKNIVLKWRGPLIALFSLIFLLSLLSLILPLTYSKRFAEKLYSGVVLERTVVLSENLFTPKYAVFTRSDEGDIRVCFVELQRYRLILWETRTVTFQEALTAPYLLEEEQSKQSDELLSSLYDSVANGDLTEGNNIDYGNVKQEGETLGINQAEEVIGGEEITTIQDIFGKHTAALLMYEDGSTRLQIDGKVNADTKNASSPAFSSDGEYIYYSKYKLVEGNVGDSNNYSGKIFRMDLGTLQEEEVYAFGESHWMSLGANEKYVVYSLENGETGVVELATGIKTVVKNFEMIDSSDPCDIIFVNDEEARISPNDVTFMTSRKPRVGVMAFDDLSYVEVAE